MMDEETKNKLYDTAWMLVIAILTAFLIFCCSGCSHKISDELVKTERDSVRIARMDSTVSKSDIHSIDTVIIDREVFVYLDTAGNERLRKETNNIYKYKYINKTDTLLKLKTDTVTKIKEVESERIVMKEAELSIIQQFLISTGRAAIFVLFILLVILTISKLTKRGL